jgi:iron complex outermembrane receptor protein
VQNLVLEDIERIEVIRGPGASVWGANAVNGVINIITKPAQETQGGLLVAGSGTEEHGFGALRYGSRAGKSAYYRVYASYFNRDDLVDQTGRATGDSWDLLQGGFRLDWDSGSADSLSVQGDVYGGDAGQHQLVASLTPPSFEGPLARRTMSGGNVLSRWSHAFPNSSQTMLQVYFDTYRRDATTLNLTQRTFDVDFQHRFLAGAHNVVWGGGYRFNNSEILGSFTVSQDPPHVVSALFSAFAQDEIALVKNRLRLVLGSKFEHNHYTGFEVQPTVRAVWTPGSNHTLWGAASRAVRMPFDLENSARVVAAVFPGQNGLPALLRIEGVGRENARSEILFAYEAGYRVSPTRTVFVDVATFFNDYHQLPSAEAETPFIETDPQPHLVIPLRLNHRGKGHTYGLETSASWQATPRWMLTAGQTWLSFHQQLGSLGQDGLTPPTPDGSPRQQYYLMSNLNLPRRFEIDASVKYVGRLKSPDTPGYTRFDVRAGWQAAENFNFSFVGQNLLRSRHIEFGDTQTNLASWSKRGFYGKLTWRF